MGEEGLKKAEQELEQAKKEHDKEIPPSILKGFPVPDVKSIAWIPVQSLQQVGTSPGRKPIVTQHKNDAVKKYVESDGPELPFFVQYDHVEVRSINRTPYALTQISFASLTLSRYPLISRWPTFRTIFARK